MQWRFPGERRWRRAGHLREIRELALAARRQFPLVQIRDDPGDPPALMLAVEEASGLSLDRDRRAQDHTGGLLRGGERG